MTKRWLVKNSAVTFIAPKMKIELELSTHCQTVPESNLTTDASFTWTNNTLYAIFGGY